MEAIGFEPMTPCLQSLRCLVTLQPAERAALAAAVPFHMPGGSLELFYRQLTYGTRLVPPGAGMQQVLDSSSESVHE